MRANAKRCGMPPQCRAGAYGVRANHKTCGAPLMSRRESAIQLHKGAGSGAAVCVRNVRRGIPPSPLGCVRCGVVRRRSPFKTRNQRAAMLLLILRLSDDMLILLNWERHAIWILRAEEDTPPRLPAFLPPSPPHHSHCLFHYIREMRAQLRVCGYA